MLGSASSCNCSMRWHRFACLAVLFYRGVTTLRHALGKLNDVSSDSRVACVATGVPGPRFLPWARRNLKFDSGYSTAWPALLESGVKRITRLSQRCVTVVGVGTGLPALLFCFTGESQHSALCWGN